MSKMRAVQVPRPNEPLELVEREIPEPDAAGSNQSTGVRNVPQRLARRREPSQGSNIREFPVMKSSALLTL